MLSFKIIIILVEFKSKEEGQFTKTPWKRSLNLTSQCGMETQTLTDHLCSPQRIP